MAARRTRDGGAAPLARTPRARGRADAAGPRGPSPAQSPAVECSRAPRARWRPIRPHAAGARFPPLTARTDRNQRLLQRLQIPATLQKHPQTHRRGDALIPTVVINTPRGHLHTSVAPRANPSGRCRPLESACRTVCRSSPAASCPPKPAAVEATASLPVSRTTGRVELRGAGNLTASRTNGSGSTVTRPVWAMMQKAVATRRGFGVARGDDGRCTPQPAGADPCDCVAHHEEPRRGHKAPALAQVRFGGVGNRVVAPNERRYRRVRSPQRAGPGPRAARIGPCE